MRPQFLPLFLALLSLPTLTNSEQPTSPPTRVPVVFSGGYTTDPRDGGRPVLLIASALHVPPDVFREAFSHVRPAKPNVGPTDAEAHANKSALLSALGKFGVTNQRLDEVSNYYRYDGAHGQLWPHQPATANALVVQGVVVGYEVIQPGSGYLCPPTVTIPQMPNATARVELLFDQDFARNGSVSSIHLVR